MGYVSKIFNVLRGRKYAKTNENGSMERMYPGNRFPIKPILNKYHGSFPESYKISGYDIFN